MKLAVILLLFVIVAGCSPISYLKTCDLNPDVTLHGTRVKDLVKNAIPRADVRCPF